MNRSEENKKVRNMTFSQDDSFKDKHLWVKKATGLGVTEFMLSFMALLCVKENSHRNSQMYNWT